MDQQHTATEMHALPRADERPFRHYLRPRFLLDVRDGLAARATHVPAMPSERPRSARFTVARLDLEDLL